MTFDLANFALGATFGFAIGALAIIGWGLALRASGRKVGQ